MSPRFTTGCSLPKPPERRFESESRSGHARIASEATSALIVTDPPSVRLARIITPLLA